MAKAKKSKRTIISSKIYDVEQMNFLSGYLGKKVFSESGDKIGTIKDVVFEKGSHKGFLLSKNLFIDKEYFTIDFEQAMMLKIEPVTSLIGKIVFDVDGKRIGKVQDIERSNNSNDFKAILVKKNIFSKPVVIEKKKIEMAKKNVILNVSLADKKPSKK